MTLPELLAARVADAPRAVAVRCGVTHEELDALAAGCAARLWDQGVRPGDRVGLLLSPSLEATVAVHGILRLGGVCVPLDPAAPPERLRRLSAQAGLAATVAGEPLVPGSFAPIPVEPDALAYLLFTSGSTGEPKAVCLTHRNILAFVGWAAACVGPQPGDVVAAVAPLGFDLSLYDLFATLAGGATLAPLPPRALLRPAQAGRWVEEQGVTVWYSTPTVLLLLLSGDAPPNPRVRLVLFAGEPFPSQRLPDLRRRFPAARLVNLYGPTETNVCTWHEVRPEDLCERPLPLGRPCDHAEVSVREGEIQVRGECVSPGYWGQPAFADEWYRTGDLARWGEDGLLHFLGRRDRMCKIRGWRVEPAEVEATLLRFEGVVLAAVVPAQGELHAFCSAREGVTASDLRRHLVAELPAALVPRRIEVLPELPRTATGKLDRGALARRALRFLLCLLFLALGCGAAPAPRGEGPPMVRPVALSATPDGRLLVCDEAGGRVLRVDPATGARTDVTGAGGQVAPSGAVADSGGRVWFTDRTTRSVYRVDPRRGRRVLVSGAGRGAGPEFGDPVRLDRLPDGRLAVLDRGRVVLVDPARGDRRPLAPLADPVDLAVTPDGDLLVLQNQPNTIVRVDPSDGTSRLAADLKRGEGPMGLDYLGLGIAPGGEVLLAEDDARLVLALDLATGRRRELSSTSRPGTLMRQVFDVAALPDGSVAVSSPWAGALLRVEPEGRRTLLSGGPLPDGVLAAVPFALARAPDGGVLFTDVAGARLLALQDPGGGFREVSGPGRGGGPPLRIPVGLALDPEGRTAWIGDRGQGVLEVDLATGDRRLLAPIAPDGLRDATLVAALPDRRLFVLDLGRAAVLEVRDGGVRPLPPGSGPSFVDPTGLGAAWGTLLVPDFERSALVAVDPATGDRRIVQDGLDRPDSVVEGPDGALLVGQETDPGSVLRVERQGGTSALPLQPVPGTPELDTPTSLVVDDRGRLLVADPGGLGCLFAVEPDGRMRALDLRELAPAR